MPSVTCPHCLEFVPVDGTFADCPLCGLSIADATSGRGAAMAGRSARVRPHRGAAVLALGIVGLFVPLVCFVAWQMGRADLRAMAAGEIDDRDGGLTWVGWLLGLVPSILCLAALAVLATAFAVGLVGLILG